MNMNFHYFTIRVLTEAIGFNAEDSQKIAFYSQFVDDHLTEGTLPLSEGGAYGAVPMTQEFDYFIRNKLYFTVKGKDYIKNVPTGITNYNAVVGEKRYYEDVTIPFHFITERCLTELTEPYKVKDSDPHRRVYRCKRYKLEDKSLMDMITYRFTKKNNDGYDSYREGWLIQLGIWLHVFADTFAHEGFSGGWGWENYSHLESVKRYDNMEKELLGFSTQLSLYRLPSIGHANVGHMPDCGALVYTYSYLDNPEDHSYSDMISWDNRKKFEKCIQDIIGFLEIFVYYNAVGLKGKIDKKNIMGNLNDKIWNVYSASTNGMDEDEDFSRLAGLWQKEFPGIKFGYDKKAACPDPNNPPPDYLAFIAYAHMHRESVLNINKNIRDNPLISIRYH